jgi:hypothetical protein
VQHHHQGTRCITLEDRFAPRRPSLFHLLLPLLLDILHYLVTVLLFVTILNQSINQSPISDNAKKAKKYIANTLYDRGTSKATTKNIGGGKKKQQYTDD